MASSTTPPPPTWYSKPRPQPVTIVNTGTAAGHLGIGIVPTERLHVSGNVLTTGNYISSAGIFNVNNTTANYSFQTNGTARFTVHNSSGNFGVGVVPLSPQSLLSQGL